jgi:hypothetical protein
MRRQELYPVPMWVRCALCVSAAVAVPGVVLAATLGADIGFPVTATVSFFAVTALYLAFNSRHPRE